MRIGIVNDLALVVEALRRAIGLRGEHSVAWTASSGEQAVERCAQDVPDLVLMDLLMPGIGGVEATRRIMAASPCPILIVTASVGGNAPLVFEAMGHGAMDATDVPSLGVDNSVGVRQLLAKIDLIGRLIGDAPVQPVRAPLVRSPGARRLVAIGASAGGPAALADLLGGLPARFPAAIVIVQHIDEKFALSMAEWLNRFSPNPVRLAMPGDRPLAGTVLLAGTNEHLILEQGGALAYTPDPVDQPYRPSVDVFFDSINANWTGDIVGVLLTGMGRDGAKGLQALRLRGHHTIAQDQASSAVYGMPKAAADRGAAVDILPLNRIASKLESLFGDTRNASS
ncbi:chemotaxis response regulator protein-glutamate methylesterase [Lysobacter capsici]|uniref:chemotaxis response regulator protein-glutamate methylesterase n=1 Tax=Lysobacter capsici TaxID=435897 RepID=UPI001BFFF4AD|nr:chemotaxis response regulator protein-glutamate methylesterase [Lysobacter capsici]QWF19547.1 chemotaxis response regulator protein-glutamate methylesterase [Lysobacter capsici]